MNKLIPLLICLLPGSVNAIELRILDCNNATETSVREGSYLRYPIPNFTVAYDSEGVSFGRSFERAAVTKLPREDYKIINGGFWFVSSQGLILTPQRSMNSQLS